MPAVMAAGIFLLPISIIESFEKYYANFQKLYLLPYQSVQWNTSSQAP